MVKIRDDRPKLVGVYAETAPLALYPAGVVVEEQSRGASVLERLAHLIHPAWHGLSRFTVVGDRNHRGQQVLLHVLPLVSHHYSRTPNVWPLQVHTFESSSRKAQELIREHPGWIERLSDDFLRFAGSVVVFSALLREKKRLESGGVSGLLSLKPELFEDSKKELFTNRNDFRSTVTDFFDARNLANGHQPSRLDVIEHAAKVALMGPYADYSQRQRSDFARICISGVIAEIKVFKALEQLSLGPKYANIEDDMGSYESRNKPKIDIWFMINELPEGVQVKSRTRAGRELVMSRPNDGIHQISCGPSLSESPVQFSDAAMNRLATYFDIYARTGNNDVHAGTTRSGNRKKGFSRDYHRPYGLKRSS